MNLSKYLDAKLVLFLEEKQREQAIIRLVDVVEKRGKILPTSDFCQAIVDREKIVSTAIGSGVAIPHAKVASCKEFFIAVGILRDGGIPWDAMDGSLVRLIFLVGGPENKQTEYLKVLSALTQCVREESRRKKLLKSVTAEQVIEALIAPLG